MDLYDDGLLRDVEERVVPQTAEFLMDRSPAKGRKLAGTVGAAYGAFAGGALLGPLGSVVGAGVGELAGGLLFDVGMEVRTNPNYHKGLIEFL